jgi:hypothetical protein
MNFATLWVMSCIHLHNFAIMHEGGGDVHADTFFIEGQKIMEEENKVWEEWARLQRERLAEEEMVYDDKEEIELLEGKLKRERLKKALKEYLYVEA